MAGSLGFHIIFAMLGVGLPPVILLIEAVLLAFYMMAHSVVGYYLATVLCVLGIYAFYMLRHRPQGRDQTTGVRWSVLPASSAICWSNSNLTNFGLSIKLPINFVIPYSSMRLPM